MYRRNKSIRLFGFLFGFFACTFTFSVGSNAQTNSDDALNRAYGAPSVTMDIPAAAAVSPNGASPTRVIEGRPSEASPLGAPPTPNPLVHKPPPSEPNEFQKFVLDATGKLLPLYGEDFFSTVDSVTPIAGTPVPSDYPLGPGDEVMIRGWGSVDIDLRAVVDRNGLINIPKVGTVVLSGVRAADAEEVIRNAISKYYRGFNLNVTLGQLRTIRIYVVGQAKRPGTYTVSSLSTLVTALFQSGGPNANGALRRIQVKRAGKQIAEMDLYQFLAKGDKSSDIKLLDGDVIVIPPAAGHVALTGKVESPAIYELRDRGDTVESLLDVAGGVPVVADPRRVLIERVDPTKQRPRTVEEFALDAAGLGKRLKDGDLVSIQPISLEFANAVTLRSSLALQSGSTQALRVPYRAGMRITDLIPSKEFLVVTAAVRRRNEAVLPPETARPQREGGSLTQRQSVPGTRAQRENEPLVQKEGGSLVQSVGNLYDEINWDYAVVERINRAQANDDLVSFNLGKALENPKGPDDIPLQPGDTVTVFSADDLGIPIAKRRVFVRVEGEVKRPGVYQVQAGERLINVVLKAGGVTQDAYLFATEFYRDAVRKSQQENLDKVIRRLEQQMLSGSAKTLANADGQDPAAARAQAALATEETKRFLAKLREIKATGRIALPISPTEPNLAQLPDLQMQNGDRLFIPNRPDFVQVFGAVNTESALVWQPGRTVADYLAQAGVTSEADDDATFLVRANGTVLSNSGRWFSSVRGVQTAPGDIIVMPEKTDKESGYTVFMRGAKDITQILSNMALGAAAIKVFRQ